MPEAWSKKRERQYEHVKESELNEGRSEKRAEEIAAVVDLLLSPEGAFFCGSVVFCDGGSDALLRTNDWPAAWDISVGDLGEQLS